MDFEAPARVSKIFGFLDFEAPARVPKSVRLFGFLDFLGTRGILDFWILRLQKSKPWGGFFGLLEFRKLERELGFWILRLPLEFPKIRNLGWDFWICEFLETRGILVRFFQGFYTV